MSPIRAAGRPPINTVKLPIAMTSGGPAHAARSPTRAAGSPPISAVGHPGGKIGPPTCGTSTVTIGQVCISPNLAAGGMRSLLPLRFPDGLIEIRERHLARAGVDPVDARPPLRIERSFRQGRAVGER